MTSVDVMGVKIEGNWEPHRKRLKTFVNPYSLLQLKHEKDICNRLSDFDVYSDGILICWLMKAFYKSQTTRISFDYTSVAPAVFESACASMKTVALVGGEEGVAFDAASILLNRYPQLQIIVTESGFFLDQDHKNKILDKASKADVVIVGMGTPYQEEFLLDLAGIGWSGEGYTCGGFLDQLVDGKGDYYPVWIDRLNLRWMYRLLKEPRRLAGRYLLIYPKFVGLFFLDWINKE